ncbi:MAG: fimbrillin family protein [Tannerellaceae bacterium]|nr:fimbrillin family protein [Tannerellaceae bacterium]
MKTNFILALFPVAKATNVQGTTATFAWVKRKYPIYLICVAGCLLCLHCVKEETGIYPPNAPEPVCFTAWTGSLPATRISNPEGNRWDTNDRIGVYMTGYNKDLTTDGTLNKVNNAPYKVEAVTDNSATFVPVDVQYAAYFPRHYEDVAFIAYSPYKETGITSDYLYPVDVSNQSSLAALDLVYCREMGPFNRNHTDVSLYFTHRLTKLEFVIRGGDGFQGSLSGMLMEIKNIRTSTTFQLSSGKLTDNGAGTKSITLRTSGTASEARAEAIVIPINANSGVTSVLLSFLDASKTKHYECLVPSPANNEWKVGTRYRYEVALTDGDRITVTGMDIVDWNDEYKRIVVRE